MKSFLEYIAKDIICKFGTDLHSTYIVFPNKRASLFLNEYLAYTAGKPLWSPVYTTISDLFRMHSNLIVPDSIKLVCDLHKCFTKCVGSDESLDHFYGWGELLLSDFDDIDKNLADAEKIFANLKSLHELDGVTYLTKEQIDIIKRFFSNFSEDRDSELKRRFMALWSKFYDIYVTFNGKLASQGLAYEGALYRKVVADENINFNQERYIFIGFNFLHKVERQLFRRLKNEGKAVFYWDFDKYYLPSGKSISNEAGYFIASYLNEFPNELDVSSNDIYNNFSSNKDIVYISAPTETSQARYVSKWLESNERNNCGRKTAIVMCNEKILKTVIHNIPNCIKNVNITTGYPLNQTPFNSLIDKLISLQTDGYSHARGKFKLRFVNQLLTHPYINFISNRCNDLYKLLNQSCRLYFVDRASLSLDEGLQMLFCNIEISNGNVSLSEKIINWILKLLERIATNSNNTNDPLFVESLFQTYTLLNRLRGLFESGDLNADINTLKKLIKQITQSTSIPFHGEPAIGIQVMGILETRNLDFEHLLILSCNEGNMPKSVNDTSFIPYSIRKAYGLTTIDHKVAIYSYYFHRLLQRAKDVTILYNSSVSNGNSGEMSRFMMQIMIESNHNIIRKSLQTGLTPTLSTSKGIIKTDKIMQELYARFDIKQDSDKPAKPLLTPSAINRYLKCQLNFFYNYVCHIKEPVNDDENIDNRVFGNIFHHAAENLYKELTYSHPTINAKILNDLLKTRIEIEHAVDDAFNKEIYKLQKEKINKTEYNGLQLINREVIIMYLRRLIELDIKQTPFNIIGLESDVDEIFCVDNGIKSFNTLLGGRVDRIDLVSDNAGGHIRVIDYKTGRKELRTLPDIDAVFDLEHLNDHSDYYLQAILYSLIISKSKKLNSTKLPVSPSLLFIQHSATENYNPTLCLGKEPIIDVECHRIIFMDNIKKIINEIFNPNIQFSPTPNGNLCINCPYAQICKN